MDRCPASSAFTGAATSSGATTWMTSASNPGVPTQVLSAFRSTTGWHRNVHIPGHWKIAIARSRGAYDNAQELGLDRSRMGVYGVSAGGGLAAAVALLLRDRGEMPLAFQLLEAPMLDDRQETPSSNLDGLAVFSKQSNEFCWRAYLGEGYGGLDVPYYAAPARVTNLSGLPPSFISVGAVDGFRDESIDYGLRLNQAGVATELHVYPGAPHGFQMFVDSRVARQAQRDSDDWLARVVREPT